MGEFYILKPQNEPDTLEFNLRPDDQKVSKMRLPRKWYLQWLSAQRPAFLEGI